MKKIFISVIVVIGILVLSIISYNNITSKNTYNKELELLFETIKEVKIVDIKIVDHDLYSATIEFEANGKHYTKSDLMIEEPMGWKIVPGDLLLMDNGVYLEFIKGTEAEDLVKNEEGLNCHYHGDEYICH